MTLRRLVTGLLCASVVASAAIGGTAQAASSTVQAKHTSLFRSASSLSAKAKRSAPYSLDKCYKSSWRIKDGHGYAGRNWCVKSDNEKTETYFDDHNNLVEYAYVGNSWALIWQVVCSGTGGYIYFSSTGAIRIYNSNYTTVLWRNGVYNKKYEGVEKLLTVTGGQHTFEVVFAKRVWDE